MSSCVYICNFIKSHFCVKKLHLCRYHCVLHKAPWSLKFNAGHECRMIANNCYILLAIIFWTVEPGLYHALSSFWMWKIVISITEFLYYSIFTHNVNVVFLTDSDDGAISLNRELPHTITEWIGTTICVSPQHGLGISPPTHVTAFQPFFLDYTMPYSIKRGEVVQLKVSLFNFLSYNLPVCM
jgi:hypothetical protein